MDRTATGPAIGHADQILNSRYVLRQWLDSGATAEVYLADDLRLSRQVAVKILRPKLARDRRAVERFRREAHAAAALCHPNIVTVYDWGVDAGTAFLVMQYVAGSDLRRLMREHGPLAEAQALRLAAEIAAGLAVAHAHGIVHRDVKPRNVLIDAHGKALLADFGIAGPSAANRAGEAVYGTALYVSPEQALGRSVDGRGDLYSLGALLYELVTGSPPFRGDSAAEIAAQHVNAAVAAPRQRRPGLSLATEQVILRALQKDPARRFADAAEMRLALLRAAEQGVGTERSSDARRLKRQDRASRGLGWAWAAGILLALAVLAVPLLMGMSTGGGRQVSVPDLAGRSQADADAAATAAGLTLAVDEQATEDTPAGIVVTQDPLPDRRVQSSSTVHAVVSSGLTVPDLGGRQCAEARAALAEAGWTVKPVRWRLASMADFGKVVAQDPPAGDVVPSKTDIRVQVAGPVRPC